MRTQLAVQWGRAIRAQRAAVGLSQEALAERVGVAQGTISKWERGDSIPSHTMIPRLAVALHTVPSVLFQYPQAVA